jgi:hypothetical protein
VSKTLPVFRFAPELRACAWHFCFAPDPGHNAASSERSKWADSVGNVPKHRAGEISLTWVDIYIRFLLRPVIRFGAIYVGSVLDDEALRVLVRNTLP